MMKKCSRCQSYFNDAAEVRECAFHNAPWIDVHVPGKGAERIGVWSCCKEVERTAPGCARSPHMEDLLTTELLRRFEVFAVKGSRAEALELLETEFLQKNLGTTKVHMMSHDAADARTTHAHATNGHAASVHPNATAKNVHRNGLSAQERAEGDNSVPEGYIKYQVQVTDTLPGLALKFHTTVATLKQLNKLFANSELYKLKHLLIPDHQNPNFPPPPSSASFSRSWHVTKLATVTGVTPEEAQFYLEDNGWDMSLAQASLARDVAWAEGELKKQKGRLREWLGDADVQTVAVVACGCVVVLLCIVL